MGIHWSEVPDGATLKVEEAHGFVSNGIKKTGKGRVVVVGEIAQLDGRDILVPVPEDGTEGGLLVLNEGQVRGLMNQLGKIVAAWDNEDNPEAARARRLPNEWV